MVGQAGFDNSSPYGTINPIDLGNNVYTTFGGGGNVYNLLFNGFGGGASAIALGPSGLSLNGETFWTNTQLKYLVVAGLLLLLLS